MPKRKRIQQSKRKSKLIRQRERISLYDYENFMNPKKEAISDERCSQENSLIEQEKYSRPTPLTELVVKETPAPSVADQRNSVFYNGPIRQGDVFWVQFSYPMRPKETKIRPVVVVQDNTSFNTLTVIPLTSSKIHSDLYCRIPLENTTLCYAEVDCISTIDRKSICSYQRTLTESEYRKIMIGILDHLGLLLKH